VSRLKMCMRLSNDVNKEESQRWQYNNHIYMLQLRKFTTPITALARKAVHRILIHSKLYDLKSFSRRIELDQDTNSKQ
jgi:hypothetical protein